MWGSKSWLDGFLELTRHAVVELRSSLWALERIFSPGVSLTQSGEGNRGSVLCREGFFGKVHC
jgi:hypothetical protein